MAGCKGLVIAAGPTYITRLWTLLELYVWVAMGKDQTRIRMLILGDANEDGAQRSTVVESFKRVSMKAARCYSEPDKEKVLAIIESSFTSLRAFDRHISRLLTEAAQSSLERRGSFIMDRMASRKSFKSSKTPQSDSAKQARTSHGTIVV